MNELMHKNDLKPFSHLTLDLERRDLSHKEKLYLREQNVITETQCTLGESCIVHSVLISTVSCFDNNV